MAGSRTSSTARVDQPLPTLDSLPKSQIFREWESPGLASARIRQLWNSSRTTKFVLLWGRGLGRSRFRLVDGAKFVHKFGSNLSRHGAKQGVDLATHQQNTALAVGNGVRKIVLKRGPFHHK